MTEDDRVKCKHCGEYPGMVSHSESTGEVYWALECDCKSTPYYRSKLVSISEWETVTFKEKPAKALAKVKIHY